MKPRGVATGRGVERAVYNEIGNRLIEDTSCWKEHHGALVPNFWPIGTSNEGWLALFSAYGSLLGIHILNTSSGLRPTSFALPLVFILGQCGLSFPLEYIQLLNPTVAKYVAVWYKFPKDAAFPKAVRVVTL